MGNKPAVGSIVYLKSGSPPLTVSAVKIIDGADLVDVEWFDGASMQRTAFHRDCLVPDDPLAAEPEQPQPQTVKTADGRTLTVRHRGAS